MGYIFQVNDVWDVCGPSIENTVSKLIEKNYIVGYKERNFDKVVVTVSKEHSAKIIFSKHFINNLRIEIDLENYFSRVGKNVALFSQKVMKSIVSTLAPKQNLICPTPTIADTLIFFSALMVQKAGDSNLPEDLARVLIECFGRMGEIEWENWEETVKKCQYHTHIGGGFRKVLVSVIEK